MTSEDFKKPFLLKNIIQNYAWGQTGKNAFIPKFLSIKVKKNIPYAELWMGAHTNGSSKIKINNSWVKLNAVLKKYPKEFLGGKKNELSFLLKILSAKKTLSIQIHPTKSQAKILHSKNPENYPDSNQKNELAIALTSFSLLFGFKKQEYLLRHLKRYSCFLNFFGKNNLEKAQKTKNTAKFILKKIIEKSKNKSELKKVIKKIESEIKKKKTKNKHELLFLKLKKECGVDVGLLISMLMNIIELKPGEGISLPANTPHSYLKGTAVECTSNSDNTIRAGLTPKFIDIKNLIKFTKYKSGNPKILKEKFNTTFNDFKIKKTILKKEKILNFKNNSLKVFLITKGKIELQWEGEKKIFKKGQAILIPAILNNYKIKVIKNTELFEAN